AAPFVRLDDLVDMRSVGVHDAVAIGGHPWIDHEVALVSARRAELGQCQPEVSAARLDDRSRALELPGSLCGREHVARRAGLHASGDVEALELREDLGA